MNKDLPARRRLPVISLICGTTTFLLLMWLQITAVVARPAGQAGLDSDAFEWGRRQYQERESTMAGRPPRLPRTNVNLSHVCDAQYNPVVNCGFESGDFSDWIDTDIASPFYPLEVNGAGQTPVGFNFFSSAPTQGAFAALHGFDGDGPGQIRVAQDILLPPGTSTLLFDYRAGWDLTFGATLDRFFQVVVEPSGGGAALQTTTVLTAAAGTVISDTGDLAGLVDLAPFAGSGIRLVFNWEVPESFTGPGFFQLDNVLINAPEPDDISVHKSASAAPATIGEPFTYTVVVRASGPPTVTFPNVVLTDTLPAAVIPGVAAATQGICGSGQTVVCNLGSLAGGQAATVTLPVTPTLLGVITNTAAVSSAAPDFNPGNNSDQLATRVVDRFPFPGLYGSTRDGELFVIDIDSGAGTLIGQLPGDLSSFGTTEIEYDNVRDRAWGQVSNGAFAGYAFDLRSGAYVAGPLANGGAHTGIEYAGAIGYATVVTAGGGTSPAWLHQVDLFQSVSTPVGYTGVNRPFSGLAYDEGSGTMYGITGGGLPADLYTIDLSTGAATFVGTTGAQAGGLQFGPDGRLYAGGSGANAGNLFVIDPANGATTLIGPTGFGRITGLTLVTGPDLLVSKTADPSPVVAGQPITYTVVIESQGPMTATGVIVTDTLPAGLSSVFVSPSPACTVGGGVVTCDLEQLGVGDAVTVSITAVVDGDVRGSLANSVVAQPRLPDAQPGDNTAIALTSVEAIADVGVAKTAEPATAVAGRPITYTLTVDNDGPSQATSVVLTDTLPAGVIYQGAFPSQGVCLVNGPTIECALGALDQGSQAVVDIVGLVDPAWRDPLTNNAEVAAAELDPALADNEAAVVSPVAAPADVRLSKSAPATAVAGAPLTYTLMIDNDGPATATGIVVTDTLPAAVQVIAVGSSQGSCSTGGTTVLCPLGTLGPGMAATVTIVVEPDPGYRGQLPNGAIVTAVETDPQPGNNIATAQTQVTGSSDLRLVKEASAGEVTLNSTLRFTVTVQNIGPSQATSVLVIDALPGAFLFESASASQGSCTHGGGIVNCQPGTMAPGATVTIVIEVRARLVGAHENVASVSAVESDPLPANNNDGATVTVTENFVYIPVITRP